MGLKWSNSGLIELKKTAFGNQRKKVGAPPERTPFSAEKGVSFRFPAECCSAALPGFVIGVLGLLGILELRLLGFSIRRLFIFHAGLRSPGIAGRTR